MNITILGSGTILSDSKRNASGYLISDGKTNLLVDCGPGILNQLKHSRMGVLGLDYIFISHFHLDHCSDLLPLLMKRYLLRKESNTDLIIAGPKGIKKMIKRLSKTQGEWLNDCMPKIVELEDYIIAGNLRISIKANLHTPESIAFRFESGNITFFYSGDMDYQAKIVDFAISSDIAILECSYPDGTKHKGHLTPLKVANFINKAKIKKTIITHIYPENDTTDLLERIQKYTTNEVIIGSDFMEIKL